MEYYIYHYKIGKNNDKFFNFFFGLNNILVKQFNEKRLRFKNIERYTISEKQLYFVFNS